MAFRPFLLVPVGAALVLTTAVEAVESSISSSDAWDPNIFDPSSFYGAPYGGYARDVRRSLSQLPLRLVGGAGFEGWDGAMSENSGTDEHVGDGSSDVTDTEMGSSSPPHFRLADADGKSFVCRVYHEDELDQHNVLGSMFDPPVSRFVAPEKGADGTDGDESGETHDGDDEEEFYYEDDDDYYIDHSRDFDDPDVEGMRIVAHDSESGFEIRGIVRGGGGGDAGSVVLSKQQPTVKTNPREMPPVAVTADAIGQKLGELGDICAQHHSGWWSYEWCNEKQVSQFHVHVEPGAEVRDETTGQVIKVEKKLEVQDVTNIGKFKRRSFRIHDEKVSGIRNIAVQDGERLLVGSAIVTDTFDSGDWCEEFNIHREVEVEIRCCPEVAKKPEEKTAESAELFGKAILKNVVEWPKRKCTYKTVVCTPLLCADSFLPATVEDDNAQNVGGAEAESATSGTTDASNEGVEPNDDAQKKKKRRRRKKKESVRDILDRALGNHCLQRAGGWWTYEFCHTKYAREFHGANVLDSTTGISRQIIEEEHALGLYHAEIHESYPDSEEPEHVINATRIDESSLIGSSSKKKKDARNNGNKKQMIDAGSAPPDAGGNGAVFIQEYTDGLVCDHSDVAESIIKGGNVVGGGIQRSTTVRYSCGKNYELVRVNEDSTCHYIFDVTVPALCGHPLFQAEVAKTQVVKCLPVAEQ